MTDSVKFYNKTQADALLAAKANAADLAAVASSGDYDDLLNKPTVPTVDSALDASSENPVQNKVIKSALDGKVDEPAAEGTSGQILTTDGSGGRSWQNAPSGLPDTTGASEGDILTLDANLDPQWQSLAATTGKVWQALDLSNLPTDFVDGDAIYAYPKFSGTTASPSTSVSAGGCLIKLYSNINYAKVPFKLIQSPGLITYTVDAIGTVDTWNNGESSDVLCKCVAWYNTDGTQYANYQVTRSMAPDYFEAMYRLVDNTGGGGSITVDNAIDASSTNPVQNAAIATALAAKAATADLATVATSGDYGDLSNTPTIPPTVTITDNTTYWTITTS